MRWLRARKSTDKDKSGETPSREKCLVTGSSGFIGSHMVNFLKNRGYWVRGVDVRPKYECYLETFEDEFYQLDLRLDENAVHMLKDIDYVFHLAANMGGIGYIMEVNAPVLYDNLSINLNMLEAARLEEVESARAHEYLSSMTTCFVARRIP